jgi:hypothetical protein
MSRDAALVTALLILNPALETFMHKFTLLLLLLSLVFCIGCGGDLGKVSGNVTLDGEPVENALITFEPEAGGRMSYGLTDKSGNYTLVYTNEQDGAEIGKHRVIIEGKVDGDPDQGIESRREYIPAEYNSQSTLTAEVTGGKQTHDFALESGGEIVESGETTD